MNVTLLSGGCVASAPGNTSPAKGQRYSRAHRLRRRYSQPQLNFSNSIRLRAKFVVNNGLRASMQQRPSDGKLLAIQRESLKIMHFLHTSVLFWLILAPSIYGHSTGRAPLRSIADVQNVTISTPLHKVHATSHFDLTFTLSENHKQIRCTLQPNQDVIADGATVQYMKPDGTVHRLESINRLEHRLFRGNAWQQNADGQWSNVGDARITIKRDGRDPLFEGVFSIFGDYHHLHLLSNYLRTRHVDDPEIADVSAERVIVFRDSDIGLTDHTSRELKRSTSSLERSCRSDELRSNEALTGHVLSGGTDSWSSMPLSSLFGKRQIDTTGIPSGGNSAGVNLKTTIGNTQGCPNSRKVALIGVATDCSYTGSFDSAQSAHANVIQQIASASSVYEKTFNITLGLRNLTVSDAACPSTPPADTAWNVGCAGNQTISDRLNAFSTWRSRSKDGNAYWTLLTNCRTGSEVGLSWLGQLCNNEVNSNNGEVLTGANIVAKTSTEWQVIAHESGHTFGAVHDCDSQTCGSADAVNSQQCCPLSTDTCDAASKYIMNPSTGQGITNFSPCTIGNVCSALGRNSVKGTCLSDNKGVTTITGHQCGNGIVEEGEDCDCGGVESCGNNQCCDPGTCKFKNNAVCDDSNEECCKGCQFASSTQVCRPSSGACDPQELCTGNSSTCPADQFTPDGQSCGNSSDNLQCASGQCTSRNQQCKTLMGSFTTKNDTYACNSQDCTLSCASPEFGPNVCYSMQQNFLDGTVCGGGGKCNNGQCLGSSASKEIGSWIHDNRNLVIGICAGLGGLILLSILSCLFRRCQRRPQKLKIHEKSSTASTTANGPAGWAQPNVHYPQHQWGSASANGQPSMAAWHGQGNGVSDSARFYALQPSARYA